jgi:hypothetical protein
MMSDELKLTLASLAAIGVFIACLAWWDYHQSSVKCHRAGVALHKSSEYSFFYGCFLDGVPGEMIREIE